ncbi:unnamed protein product [Vicia faba]|uniref:Uncharacterized protein n=1 Tax=Vicia faba TaxID=3906 RepID=A0AAV0Z0N6_VICFA|nr:unnamed protein product [Vicia faba]
MMTNAVVVAMSKNCPNLVVFRLCIIEVYRPHVVPQESMDEGFGVIVMNCKKLTRQSATRVPPNVSLYYLFQGNQNDVAIFHEFPSIYHIQEFVRKDIIRWLQFLHHKLDFYDFCFPFAKG